MIRRKFSSLLLISLVGAMIMVGISLATACTESATPSSGNPHASTSQPLESDGAANEIAESTFTPTHAPTHTPTSTVTPSPTFTPTPTAIPIHISGNPRAALVSGPTSQAGARCGVVDLLDFPLDPPNGTGVMFGGQDFGVFRGRYDQYHAGEDWGFSRGRSNLGMPVYSIGHGTVTYAQPLGWGRDQGVVIIRHEFADGSSILSFYGHLDPPSVITNAGECVSRGEKIGEIGKPRTPPHLHFEIRSHLPNEPGGGYWPVDPRQAGWESPSQFIWTNRITALPGIQWVRPFETSGTKLIGLLNDKTLMVQAEGKLLGIDLGDGDESWTFSGVEEAANAMLDKSRSLLFVSDRRGLIAAHLLLPRESGDAFPTPDSEPIWTIDLKIFGDPTLIPLPGGGVLLSVRQRMTAVSAAGKLLWEHEFERQPFDWIHVGDQLILSTTGVSGSLWTVNETGPIPWVNSKTGRLLEVDDQVWLYNDEGIYLLNTQALTAERLVELPRSFMGLGGIVTAPDGTVLLAHTELNDKRLIAFNQDSSIRWQRSFASIGVAETQLVVFDDQIYLLTQSTSSSSSEIALFSIDSDNLILTQIFMGGTRAAAPANTWMVAVSDEYLLINIGGGQLVAFDPRAAADFFLSAN